MIIPSGPFYIKRFPQHKGKDQPSDLFGVFLDSETLPPIGQKAGIAVTVIVNMKTNDSVGSKNEATLLCNNLNAAWEAFHMDRMIEIARQEPEVE